MVAGSSLPPGIVCVQWIWAGRGGFGCAGGDRLTFGTNIGGVGNPGNELNGLYPERTAFILLGSPPATNGEDGGSGRPSPSIIVSRVLASRVDGLKRRASQLKVWST